MLITRQSQWSGITRTLDIPVTHDQMYEWQQRGALIQNAMPNLTADQREFLMTGVTKEERELIQQLRLYGYKDLSHYQLEKHGHTVKRGSKKV